MFSLDEHVIHQNVGKFLDLREPHLQKLFRTDGLTSYNLMALDQSKRRYLTETKLGELQESLGIEPIHPMGFTDPIDMEAIGRSWSEEERMHPEVVRMIVDTNWRIFYASKVVTAVIEPVRTIGTMFELFASIIERAGFQMLDGYSHHRTQMASLIMDPNDPVVDFLYSQGILRNFPDTSTGFVYLGSPSELFESNGNMGNRVETVMRTKNDSMIEVDLENMRRQIERRLKGTGFEVRTENGFYIFDLRDNGPEYRLTAFLLALLSSQRLDVDKKSIVVKRSKPTILYASGHLMEPFPNNRKGDWLCPYNAKPVQLSELYSNLCSDYIPNHSVCQSCYDEFLTSDELLS